jgi:hypothetical protein
VVFSTVTHSIAGSISNPPNSAKKAEWASVNSLGLEKTKDFKCEHQHSYGQRTFMKNRRCVFPEEFFFFFAQNSSDYLTGWFLKICLGDVLYQIAEDSCHNGYYYYFLNLVLLFILY